MKEETLRRKLISAEKERTQKLLNGHEDYLLTTDLPESELVGEREAVRHLRLLIEHLDEELSVTDNERPRYYRNLSIPNWMPEVQMRLQLPDAGGKLLAGKYIRRILLWADDLLDRPLSDMGELPEPDLDPRISTSDIVNTFPYLLGKTERRFTFLDSDRYLFTRIGDALSGGKRAVFGHRLEDLRISTTDELIVFLIFCDVFKGYMSWSDLCGRYRARAERHRYDGNKEYVKYVREQFRYRVNFSVDYIPFDGGRHLSALSSRTDVPSFLRWLIRCDMKGERIPYHSSECGKKGVRRYDVVKSTVITLEPYTDNDVKEWLDTRGWLSADPSRWGISVSMSKSKDSWKGKTSISHYVQQLVYDYYS